MTVDGQPAPAGPEAFVLGKNPPTPAADFGAKRIMFCTSTADTSAGGPLPLRSVVPIVRRVRRGNLLQVGDNVLACCSTTRHRPALAASPSRRIDRPDGRELHRRADHRLHRRIPGGLSPPTLRLHQSATILVVRVSGKRSTFASTTTPGPARNSTTHPARSRGAGPPPDQPWQRIESRGNSAQPRSLRTSRQRLKSDGYTKRRDVLRFDPILAQPRGNRLRRKHVHCAHRATDPATLECDDA